MSASNIPSQPTDSGLPRFRTGRGEASASTTYSPDGTQNVKHSTTSSQTSSSTAVSSLPPRSRTLIDERNEAWRYRGYRSFSRWMASDDDFFVLRRFSDVSARCVLLMQDHIQELAGQLENEDLQCQDEAHHGGQFRGKKDCDRRKNEILEQLTTMIERYNRFVLDHSEIKARPAATAKQMNNVITWLSNNPDAIRGEETEFLESRNDLMALVPKRPVPLRRGIDRYLSAITELKWFQEKRPNGSQDPSTIYNKEARIDKVMTFIVVSVGVCMLLGPLWLLQLGFVHDWDTNRLLGIITGFIVVFTLLLGTVTVAQPFEVLAAVAAYTAVLTVFLQMAGGNRRGPD